MDKKGELIVLSVVAFVVVAGALIFGSYLIIAEDNGYIGDISTKDFFDIKCKKNIDVNERVFFESYGNAKLMGFNYKKC